MDITYEQLMDTQVTRLEDLFDASCLDDTKPATQTQRIMKPIGDLDMVPVDSFPLYPN